VTQALIEWPDHFPENCPPADAPDPAGIYLRFVESLPPTPKDFVSYLQQGRSEGMSEVVRAGLSVYSTRQQMEKKRALSPLLRTSVVAQARLEPKHGKVSFAGSRGHRTLWLRRWALEQAPTLFGEEAP
jgi:hypothetical protein